MTAVAFVHWPASRIHEPRKGSLSALALSHAASKSIPTKGARRRNWRVESGMTGVSTHPMSALIIVFIDSPQLSF